MTVNSTWLPAVRQGRPAVAWSTVLPLAAAMAYADGFWMLSARGAVGAIERTQAPFTSWWRESTLVIPFFVVAVLGAAVLALRWFGPAPRTPRATVATAALVVGLGSITGIAALAASSAYDYKLESEQLQFMNSMRGICVGDCLDQARQSTLGTQVKAVLLVSGFLVVTNLLLVAWVVAVKGGRLNLTSVTQHDGASEAGGGARSRARDLRVVLAAVLIGSATIHAAVVPGQLAAWTAAGVLFIVLSVAELVVAALIQVSQRRVMLIIAAAVSAVPLVLWIYSRTAGLPFGPAAGLPDRRRNTGHHLLPAGNRRADHRDRAVAFGRLPAAHAAGVATRPCAGCRCGDRRHRPRVRGNRARLVRRGESGWPARNDDVPLTPTTSPVVRRDSDRPVGPPFRRRAPRPMRGPRIRQGSLAITAHNSRTRLSPRASPAFETHHHRSRSHSRHGLVE